MNGWAAICRLGGIGDNLMAATVLPSLKKQYGKVEVLTRKPMGVVFENNPHIDKLSFVDEEFLPKNDIGAWQRYFEGRAKEYQAFFHLSHSCETTRALFIAQTAFYWPASMRRKLCGQNYIETVFDICECPYDGIGERVFFPTDEEHAKAEETKKVTGERFIAWVISGTRLDKIYPYASPTIAQLVRDVAPVVMLGAGPRDFEYAKLIMEDVIKINGSPKDLHLGLSPADTDPPSWPPRRLLTFAQHAVLVISPDTGPAWSVAFEEMPKIMLLSHASAENITKYWTNTTTLHAEQIEVPCWPCHRLHDTPATCVPNKEKNGAACISAIKVQTIIEAAETSLSVKEN
jgi:ADP-heptose:LPS heptosyltransferase